MPFDDGVFDLVTAVETHYYWPNLPADLREIRRVLKPGGRVLLIAEGHRGRRFDLAYRIAIWLLGGRCLSPGEQRDLLNKAGFVGICARAKAPG